MSSLNIHPIQLINIRDYPNVNEEMLTFVAKVIWDDREYARLASNSFIRSLNGLEPDNTQYFFIVLNGNLYGIIGFYEMPEDRTVIGIAWSGVFLSARGTGIYKSALYHMMGYITNLYEEVQFIEELVPPGSQSIGVIHAFRKIGFEFYGIHTDNDPFYNNGTKLRITIK